MLLSRCVIICSVTCVYIVSTGMGYHGMGMGYYGMGMGYYGMEMRCHGNMMI